MTLKLGLRCVCVPLFAMKIRNVLVKSFTNKRTCTYGSVTTIRRAILIMALLKNACPDYAQFIQIKSVKISNKQVKKIVKMFNPSFSAVKIMSPCDAVVVID